MSPELCAMVETIQRLQLLAQSATLTFLYRGLSAVIPCELLPMFSADEVVRAIIPDSMYILYIYFMYVCMYVCMYEWL